MIRSVFLSYTCIKNPAGKLWLLSPYHFWGVKLKIKFDRGFIYHTSDFALNFSQFEVDTQPGFFKKYFQGALCMKKEI